MSVIFFSIIIVNYNTRDLLRSCLKSIRMDIHPLSLEIIVVDNHSSDGSTDMLRQEFPAVAVIENTDNLGFSKACNQGIRASRGRYIILLNSDTELLPDTLESLGRLLVQELPNSIAGIVGCRLMNPDGSLQYSTGNFPSLWSTIRDMFRPRHLRKYDLTGYDHAHDVDWVTGAFLLIRRSVVEDIGLLDERFFMYYEEVDWCLRARKRGWSVLYDPTTSIIHKAPLASKKNRINLKIVIEVRRSHLYYFRKNRGIAEFVAVACATLFLLLVKRTRWDLSFFAHPDVRSKNREEAGVLLSSVWVAFRELISDPTIGKTTS